MALALLALAVGALVLWAVGPAQPAQPPARPYPRGDWRAEIAGVMLAAGAPNIVAAEALATQAALETGSGSGAAFRATNNLFSIHGDAGRPNPFWGGRTHTTSHGEILRVYSSVLDSARDMLRLLRDSPRYAAAWAALKAADAAGYFRAVAAGGFAEDPRYADSLARLYGGRHA